MNIIKSIFVLLFLLLVNSSFGQLVTGNLIITNAPINGSTLTVNSQVFVWTNGTPVGSFAIQITNTLGGDGTNLFNVAGLVLPNIGVSIAQTNGTNLTFSGNQMAMSKNGNWASLVLTTNTTGSASNVVVPMSVIAAQSRTNIASQLIADLNLNDTNAINQSNIIAAQLAGLSKSNNFAGTNIITNIGNVFGGTVTNPAIYNGSNFGLPFRSPGSGNGSEQFGIGATANASGSIAIGDLTTSQDVNSTALGTSSQATGQGSLAVGFNSSTLLNNDTALGANTDAGGGASIAIGNFSETDGTNSIAIGPAAVATQSNSVAIGSGAISGFANSTAIGQNSVNTVTNQVALGVANGTVFVPGNFQVAGAIVNANNTGTDTVNAVFVGTRFINTALANGQNQDVVLGTNMTTQLSAVTANFTTAGFVGGIADRYAFVFNPTIYNWTIENDSGFESTPANRILTGTGASVILSSNSWALFNYDSSVTHWRLLFASGSPSTGGSGTFSGTFSGNGGALTNVTASGVSSYRAGFQAIGNLATSQAVTFTTPLASIVGTNYSVTVSSDSTLASAVGFAATSKTTNGFTITLSAGVAGGIGVDYTATPYQ